MIDRRSLLARSAVLAAGALCPTLLHAATAATDKRFVFIIQRGAADGLHIVPPMGDPAFASLRGGFLDRSTTRIDWTAPSRSTPR
jgi:uncharacterized protein (DUF1501 family)